MKQISYADDDGHNHHDGEDDDDDYDYDDYDDDYDDNYDDDDLFFDNDDPLNAERWNLSWSIKDWVIYSTRHFVTGLSSI